MQTQSQAVFVLINEFLDAILNVIDLTRKNRGRGGLVMVTP